MTRPLHGQTYVWLHVFSCAARHLSFTRCAEELHITPGAVSQQIRQLEERLGFRLFHRRARGVELSAEGQRLSAVVGEAYGSIDAELQRLDLDEFGGDPAEAARLRAAGLAQAQKFSWRAAAESVLRLYGELAR